MVQLRHVKTGVSFLFFSVFYRMSRATIGQVFSVPFRHLRSTNFSGDQVVSQGRPNGLARFVGDEKNEMLKFLVSICRTVNQSDESSSENSQAPSDSSSAKSVLQWPLVLFGPSGTGKTWLALTLISELSDQQQNSQDTKPLSMTALDFDRRYRSAIETDSVEDLRQRMVQSSGLVIDDIHRLDSKPATQAELALILDRMHAKNRPIVVTMDVSPQECDGLLSQLVSRLLGGLCLPVNPPGPAARLEIIRDLATINQLNLTENAIQLLVDQLNVTVPKLDHFFAQAKITLLADDEQNPDLPIDAAKLTQLFKKSDVEIDQLSKLIIKLVAAEFHLKPSELKSNSRKQTIVLARGVAIYLSRILLGSSFLKIGTYFGNRDHSTIMHAFRKIETITKNSNTDQDTNSLKTTIRKLKQKLAEQFASQMNFV